jgi:CubicO group peptidase (beta-lactamase class C family)
MKWKWILISVAGLLLLAPATASAAPPVTGDEWPMSSPAEQGLSEDRLNDLVRAIRAGQRYPDVHSLLIVRNGCLVVEEYFDGWDSERLHTLQSVTKSFTSALIGIAIGRGEIRGGEKILDFFPDRKEIRNLDDRKRAITIEHQTPWSSSTPTS